MKSLILLLIAAFSLSFQDWHSDFEKAKKLAKDQNRHILLNFSGSDWCGPCIRLKKEVFDNGLFRKLADSSLVLFNADFPRSKKNQLPKEIQRVNERLAEQYNPLGKFPFTVLLTAEGKVVRAWEGYPQNNSALFIDQVKSVCNGGPK